MCYVVLYVIAFLSRFPTLEKKPATTVLTVLIVTVRFTVETLISIIYRLGLAALCQRGRFLMTQQHLPMC